MEIKDRASTGGKRRCTKILSGDGEQKSLNAQHNKSVNDSENLSVVLVGDIVFLHLFVQRRPINSEHPSGLLSIPSIFLQSIQDDLTFGISQSGLQIRISSQSIY